MNSDFDHYTDHVLLTKVAAYLSVSQVQLRMWAPSNGFVVDRMPYHGYWVPGFPKTVARQLIDKAMETGFSNPCIKEDKKVEVVPDRSNEPRTLAYSLRHPTRMYDPPVRRVKAPPSWELGSKGDMQPLTLTGLRKALGSGSEMDILKGCQQFEPELSSYDQAIVWIWIIIDELLERGRYRAVALLLWGPDIFDSSPPSVGRILSVIEQNSKIIILGAGSQGKTYTCTSYLVLDWLADPEFTAARIVSVTGSHALEQAFSAMQRLYHGSLLKLPGVSQKGFIGLSTVERHASLSIIAVEPGEANRQVLRGFHPIRRPVPHPKYGKLSRDRILIDEAIMVPVSVWTGISNVLGSLTTSDSVKVICCANPSDPVSHLANLSAPEKGWMSVDVDSDLSWVSKAGWTTIRIDAATSPNVVTGEVIHDGFMTRSGYMEYVTKGTDHPEYECFARGIFPRTSSPDCLIPLNWMDRFVGTFIFDVSPAPVVVAGIDLALDGDDCIMVVGTYGKSDRWIRAGSSEVIHLDSAQHVLQLDTWLTLSPKSRSGARYEEIQALVKKFGIAYEFLSLDSTGVGRGTVDNFLENGYKVRAVSWGGGATHTKVLEEDTRWCDELYSDITSEMYHAMRSWIEGEFIKASPFFDLERPKRELTGRRRKPSGRLGPAPHHEPLIAIEKKREFKARYGGRSPDVADAIAMCLHGCRMGGPELVRIIRRRNLRQRPLSGDEDLVSLQTIDFSE